MRGTLGFTPVLPSVFGIIPAHAGNTRPASPNHRAFWDHPRACGEHYKHRGSVTPNPGSSPRMRGTPVHAVIFCGGWGIIPAHAGNTWSTVAQTVKQWDHPRACGEHRVACSVTVVSWGSSPRMRGTQAMTLPAVSGAGIIPAHAGNTPARHQSKGGKRDHPRACGEHRLLVPSCIALRGSSPRMRGTPSPSRRPQSPPGIIPAHAGNTSVINGIEWES